MRCCYISPNCFQGLEYFNIFMRNPFFITRSLKGKIISTVVLVSLFVVYGIYPTQVWLYQRSWEAVVFFLVALIIPLMVLLGWKVGYGLAQVVAGFLAIVVPVVALNPLEYHELDIQGRLAEYHPFLIKMFLFEIFILFALYCLQEHSLMRTGLRNPFHKNIK